MEKELSEKGYKRKLLRVKKIVKLAESLPAKTDSGKGTNKVRKNSSDRKRSKTLSIHERFLAKMNN